MRFEPEKYRIRELVVAYLGESLVRIRSVKAVPLGAASRNKR